MEKKIIAPVLLVATLLLMAGCDFSVNESYHLRDGEKRNTGMNTVNGTIDIGANCVVRGTCRTVNGEISVGQNSVIKEIQTVNGNIEIGENVTVKRDIKTVTSDIFCDKGSNISGGIVAINAKIKLKGSRVKEDIEILVGKIELLEDTEVHGSIIVGKPDAHYKFDETAKIEIYIADGAVIDGDIDIQQDQFEARVYLAAGGKVAGEIYGAEVIRE